MADPIAYARPCACLPKVIRPNSLPWSPAATNSAVGDARPYGFRSVGFSVTIFSAWRRTTRVTNMLMRAASNLALGSPSTSQSAPSRLSAYSWPPLLITSVLTWSGSADELLGAQIEQSLGQVLGRCAGDLIQRFLRGVLRVGRSALARVQEQGHHAVGLVFAQGDGRQGLAESGALRGVFLRIVDEVLRLQVLQGEQKASHFRLVRRRLDRRLDLPLRLLALAFPVEHDGFLGARDLQPGHPEAIEGQDALTAKFLDTFRQQVAPRQRGQEDLGRIVALGVEGGGQGAGVAQAD